MSSTSTCPGTMDCLTCLILALSIPCKQAIYFSSPPPPLSITNYDSDNYSVMAEETGREEGKGLSDEDILREF